MHFPPEGASCRPCRHMLAPCPRITRCYHSTFDPCFIRLQPLPWASIGSLQPASPPCSVFPPLGLATGHVPRAPRLCDHAPAGPGSLPAEGPRGMGVSGGGAGGVLLAKRRLRRSGGSGWMPGSSIGRRAGAAGVSGCGSRFETRACGGACFPSCPYLIRFLVHHLSQFCGPIGQRGVRWGATADTRPKGPASADSPSFLRSFPRPDHAPGPLRACTRYAGVPPAASRAIRACGSVPAALHSPRAVNAHSF